MTGGLDVGVGQEGVSRIESVTVEVGRVKRRVSGTSIQTVERKIVLGIGYVIVQ